MKGKTLERVLYFPSDIYFLRISNFSVSSYLDHLFKIIKNKVLLVF